MKLPKLKDFHVLLVNTTVRWVEEGKVDVRKRETEINSPNASLTHEPERAETLTHQG